MFRFKWKLTFNPKYSMKLILSIFIQVQSVTFRIEQVILWTHSFRFLS